MKNRQIINELIKGGCVITLILSYILLEKGKSALSNTLTDGFYTYYVQSFIYFYLPVILIISSIVIYLSCVLLEKGAPEPQGGGE